MKKVEILKLIQSLYQEMKALTLEAGISEKKYDNSLLVCESDNFNELRKLHTWALEIRQGPYQSALEIKRLQPQEYWDKYIYYDLDDSVEMRLLKERLSALRKSWRKPYRAKKLRNQTSEEDR